MSQNESLVTRWLERRPETPSTWRDRVWAGVAHTLVRIRAAKIEAARRLTRLAANRAVACVLRAPARWAAGATASLSGVVMAIWMTFFPGPPTTTEPAAPKFAGLSEVASSEIAPACEDEHGHGGKRRSSRPEPNLLTVPDPESAVAGRPSPFYTTDDVEHANHEEPDGPVFPMIDQIEHEKIPARPPVWLSGTIEAVDTTPALDDFDRRPGFGRVEDAVLPAAPAFAPNPMPRFPSDVRPARRPYEAETGPAIVIQPR